MDYEKKYNNALERAKHAIEDCGDNQGRKNMIYGIFPELAESEEDEKMIIYARKYLDDALHEIGYSQDSQKEIKECMDWLKSLRPRPHWKPSEEQMDAFKYALGEGGKFDKAALESLYEQLKKL